MKIKQKLCIAFISIFIFSNTSNSQSYFPLEIGNRWDYYIYAVYHGWIREDTLSIEIIDTIKLNGNNYFVFSSYPPIGYFSKYFREEQNKIYYYNEQDSTDCFAFRFDMPIDNSYLNCFGWEIYIRRIDTLFLWGKNDIQQYQNDYIFSEHYGIYHVYKYNIEDIFYDLYGCIISGITYGNLLVNADEENGPPINFTLEQNYPNPFNPITTINYSIPENSIVLLKVFDLLGREITTLVSEEKIPGRYQTHFDGSNLPSSVYFYKLQAGSFVETKKMILMR